MFGTTPKKIGEFILKYRWLIIVANILLLAVVVMAIGKRGENFQKHTEYMQHIRNNPLDKDSSHIAPPPFFDADYHVFFEKDNPELVAYDQFQEVYSKEENLIVVVVAKNGDVFTNESLAS